MILCKETKICVNEWTLEFRVIKRSMTQVLPTLFSPSREHKPVLSKEFIQSRRPQGFERMNVLERPLTAFKSPYQTALVSITPLNTEPKKRIRMKMKNQRNELSRWVDEERPKPVELLLKLAQTDSPFCKFFQTVAEELDIFCHRPKSNSLVELEKDTTLKLAKNKIDIQSVQSEINKNQLINQDLKDKVKKQTSKLNIINNNVSILNSLAEKYGCNEVTLSKEEESESPKRNSDKQKCELDDSEYNFLLDEQNELLDEVEQLKTTLDKVQNMQIDAIKEASRRKIVDSGINSYY